MELITLERGTGKSPKEMLLELFAKDKEAAIIMMSKDFFNEFCECERVYEFCKRKGVTHHHVYHIYESAYAIHKDLSPITEFKIDLWLEVKLVENVWIIIGHDQRILYGKQPAQRIYYFK